MYTAQGNFVNLYNNKKYIEKFADDTSPEDTGKSDDKGKPPFEDMKEYKAYNNDKMKRSFIEKAYYEKLLTLLNKEITDNTDLGSVAEKKILNLSLKDIAILGANQDKFKPSA